MEPLKKIPITFITGNKKKLEEFLAIMSDELAHYYTVDSKEIDRNIETKITSNS
jgi:inosine/xanthosine triphosphate pyrophosphatase family protein